MLGRGDDKRKRFYLGIYAMKYIVQKLPKAEMIIISYKNNYLENLVKNLKLEKNIKFVGYEEKPEKYFKNASLHILPSSTEAFPLALCETKIHGIPNIVTGLDYVSPAKGGVIIIYNDNPKIIAREAIKILKNISLRKNLGKEARKSMKVYRNKDTTKKWVKLILAIYKGKNHYDNLRKKFKKISPSKALIIIKKQIELLKQREQIFRNITFENIINILKNPNS